MALETVAYQHLLDYARTTVELSLLQEEIRLLQAALYTTQEQGFEQVLQDKVRFEVAEIVRPLLMEQSGNQHQVLEEILQAAREQKRLSLTIAFRPSSSFVTTLVSWVRSHLGQGIVVDFRYEPAVVGGAVIEFNGHYGDFSLKKKFQAYFDAQLMPKTDQNQVVSESTLSG